ncbi:hypothetical protein BVH56_04830 [Abyssicoccus albus]|nr:hypothetical protein BVH56_04830 [Abyssicoccus albus]
MVLIFDRLDNVTLTYKIQSLIEFFVCLIVNDQTDRNKRLGMISMKKIGQKLKAKRESLGITLLDLQNKTNISRETITYIEQNEFYKIKNNHYLNTMIKRYAKHVHLDGEKLLQEHKNELPKAKNIVNETEVFEQTSNREHSKQYSKFLKFIIGLVALLLTIFLLYVISFSVFSPTKDEVFNNQTVNDQYKDVAIDIKDKKSEDLSKTKSKETNDQSKVNENESDSKAENDKKNKESKEDDEKEVKDVSIAFQTFDGNQIHYDVEAEEALTLDIQSEISNWVQVIDENNKTHFQGEITSKKIELPKSVKTVTFISGNSSNMVLKLNGQEVKEPSEASSLITRRYIFNVKK